MRGPILDLDGTLVGTTGSCKEGLDIAYDGTWGYHPLVVSLANTRGVLSLVNRPGNRPSQEGAAAVYRFTTWVPGDTIRNVPNVMRPPGWYTHGLSPGRERHLLAQQPGRARK
jgi:hypothetical protein